MLVSRRWLTCAYAPSLWRELDVNIRPAFSGHELPSLRRWLLRHGQHLRRLSLTVCPSYGGKQRDAVVAASVEPQLEKCLTALASVAQRLESLTLMWQLVAPLVATAWLLQLPASLRELGLLTCSQLHISASLGSLTQLTQLLLLSRDAPAVVEAGVSLPPCVRMMALCDDGEVLPNQASFA